MNFKPTGIYHRRLHKLDYYVRHAHLGLIPLKYWQKSFEQAMSAYRTLSESDRRHLDERIHYYNQLTEKTPIIQPYTQIGAFQKKGFSAYFYDLADYLRYFPMNQAFAYEFGDVQHIPAQPTFVKSRPISSENQNSILLKLDSVRHFYIYPDPYSFENKKDLLVWRGASHQAHRQKFLEKHYDNPLCDVACVHRVSADKPYHGSFLSVQEQLQYKYILSIEGNDVATNLKWIMASHSVCLMTTPKFETWAMEGRLLPDVHYIHLQDDYSDLNEKLAFYQKNPQSAQKIIQNAQKWMQPFLNPKLDLMANLLVIQKYFDLTEAK